MRNEVAVANLVAFLDILFGQCEPSDTLAIIHRTRKRLRACLTLGNPDHLVEAAKTFVGEHGLYFKVNPVSYEALNRRSEETGKPVIGSLDEITKVVAIALDVDADKADYPTRDEVFDALYKMPHPPSLVINSDGGVGGLHVYWLLRVPVDVTDDARRTDMAKVSARWQLELNRLLFGRLDSTADLTRFLRLPFIPRYKGGRRPTLHYYGDHVYDVDDFRLPEEKIIRPAMQAELTEYTPSEPHDGDRPIDAYLDAEGITPVSMLKDMGYEEINDGWRRPESGTGDKTLKLSTTKPGVNVFSGGDPHLSNLDDLGRPGRLHSRAAMYVAFYHAGDWKAAARECNERMTERMLRGQ